MEWVLARPGLSFLELRAYAASGDGHHDCLCDGYFLICDTLIPGDAKVVLHSGTASDRHRGCEVKQQGCLHVEDVIAANGIVELIEHLLVPVGYHG
jgi:hypothetical protein